MAAAQERSRGSQLLAGDEERHLLTDDVRASERRPRGDVEAALRAVHGEAVEVEDRCREAGAGPEGAYVGSNSTI